MADKKKTVPLTAAVLQNFSGQASETWKDKNGIDMYITYIDLHNNNNVIACRVNIPLACININMLEHNC